MIRNPIDWLRAGALLIALLPMGGAAVHAQTEVSKVGNLEGTVRDQGDNRIYGAKVAVTGQAYTEENPAIEYTTQEGTFRFVELDDGNYRLKVELEGYMPLVVERVSVKAGRTTSLELQLKTAI